MKNTPDNPEQYRRFVETAREVGADESPDALDRVFDKVVGPSSVDASTAARVRAKLAEAERELEQATDAMEQRRLRVRINSLKRLVG